MSTTLSPEIFNTDVDTFELYAFDEKHQWTQSHKLYSEAPVRTIDSEEKFEKFREHLEILNPLNFQTSEIRVCGKKSYVVGKTWVKAIIFNDMIYFSYGSDGMLMYPSQYFNHLVKLNDGKYQTSCQARRYFVANSKIVTNIQKRMKDANIGFYILVDPQNKCELRGAFYYMQSGEKHRTIPRSTFFIEENKPDDWSTEVFDNKKLWNETMYYFTKNYCFKIVGGLEKFFKDYNPGGGGKYSYGHVSLNIQSTIQSGKMYTRETFDNEWREDQHCSLATRPS